MCRFSVFRAITWVGRLAGIENVAAIAAGIAMVITGLVLLGFGLRSWVGFALPNRFLRQIGKLISSRSVASKFALGLLMGLLPCGLVYAALMKAIGTAAPIAGALTLMAFGLGTSVSLVVVGLGTSAATREIARWGTTISAITVMATGAILIARGPMAGPVMHRHMPHMAL